MLVALDVEGTGCGLTNAFVADAVGVARPEAGVLRDSTLSPETPFCDIVESVCTAGAEAIPLTPDAASAGFAWAKCAPSADGAGRDGGGEFTKSRDLIADTAAMTEAAGGTEAEDEEERVDGSDDISRLCVPASC